MTDGIRCPVCQETGFTTRMERLDLAYFDEVIQLSYTCDACGFRRNDLHITKEDEPARYRLEITSQTHLSTRVIRSASGHFEIPELDIRAEPGEAADAFVSNVEGVLNRCVSAIQTAKNGAQRPEQRDKAEALLAKADRMRELEETWSLVIEDPLGNSAILSDVAEREVLSEEEVEQLGLPYPVVELSDIEDDRGEPSGSPGGDPSVGP